MNNYSIDFQPLKFKCIVKAKNRFAFVVSYFIGLMSLTIAIVISVVIVITDFKLSFLLVVPLLVLTIFTFLFLFLSNKIMYFLKGNEVFYVKDDVFCFYRKGYFEFHKELFHINRLIKIGLVSKDKPVLLDDSYEGSGGKIFLSFKNKSKSMWGNITKDLKFGASLSDSDAEQVVLAIRDFLDSLEPAGTNLAD